MPKNREFKSIAQLYPGLVGERAREFMKCPDPLDLFAELATARAALSLEAERYGIQHEAAMAAMNAEKPVPFKDPDVRGVIAALQTVDRIVGRIREIQFLDAVPVEDIRSVFEAMRASLRLHLADRPDVISKIEDSWEALQLG